MMKLLLIGEIAFKNIVLLIMSYNHFKNGFYLIHIMNTRVH